MVFEQLDGDGVGELWMTYRHVCKAWRTAAELAFQVHLPNIRIDFEPRTSLPRHKSYLYIY